MNDNPFFEKPEPLKKNWFIFILQAIVIMASIIIILYLFIITPNQVRGPSMEKNFFTGEILLSNRLTQWIGSTPFGKSIGIDYKRGDVVVLQKPGFEEFVKRIIGLPGDRVAIRDGYVFINGKKLQENYLGPSIYTGGGDFIEDGGESKIVPEGYYYVMGDNRGVSNDSRYSEIGFIDRNWLKGKVIIRFFPFDKFGLIPTGGYTLE
jgi:signal peptidase I